MLSRTDFSSCRPEINIATWKNDGSFYSTERNGTLLISWSRNRRREDSSRRPHSLEQITMIAELDNWFAGNTSLFSRKFHL